MIRQPAKPRVFGIFPRVWRYPELILNRLESTPADEPGVPELLEVDHTEPDGTLNTDEQIFDISGDFELSPKKGKPGHRRRPEVIDTIVLHQTACRFGTTKRNRDKYGEQAALHRRFHMVACHMAALRCGDVLKVNDFRSYIYHAHAKNSTSIGFEVEGLYAGLEGDLRTVWRRREPDTLDQRTIRGARQALRFMVEQGRAEGLPLEFIAPHRAYSASRRSDPGEELWREVAIWGVENLGLRVKYDETLRDGRPVPREWDPAAGFDWLGRVVR